MRRLGGACLAFAALVWPAAASAQSFTQRGFVEGIGVAFPQQAPNDSRQAMADLRAREELFVKPSEWLQLAGGMEFRANSYHQVADDWSVDYWDRGIRRPRLSVTRLAATLNRGPITIDLGKQYIRWGAADIVNPTDRFAPRDFMNVIDADFLGITAARAVVRAGGHVFEVVWTPRFTPSRVPLVTERWTPVPPAAQGLPIEATPAPLPTRSQVGGRWRHFGDRFEYSLSYFDGFNTVPDIRPSVVFPPLPPFTPTAIAVTNVYPRIRSYGGDLAWPLRWFTLKAEAAYNTAPSQSTDEYGLYVLQLERDSGEWVFIGGYAGEAVHRTRTAVTFAPDRGISRSILGRVSRTIDVNRTVLFEAAVHQDGRGAYAKAEYSQAHGQHWRVTMTAVGIGGHTDDFFGQYHDNSNVKLTARYSF